MKNMKINLRTLLGIAFLFAAVFIADNSFAAPSAVELSVDHADRIYVESSRAKISLKINQKPSSPDFRNSIEATYVLPTQQFRVVFVPRGDGYQYVTPKLPLGAVHLYVNVYTENGKQVDQLRKAIIETQRQIADIDQQLSHGQSPELEEKRARLIDTRNAYQQKMQASRVSIFSQDVAFTVISASRPTAKIKLISKSSETVPTTALFDASESTDPSGLPLMYTYSFGEKTLNPIQAALGTHTYENAGTFTVTVTVTNSAGASDSATTTIHTVAPALPPPPEQIAPPLPPETPVPIEDQVKFIYEGENAPQKNVAPEAIQPDLASGFRGFVKDDQGNPLAAVKVSVAGEPQFGSTLTREDGSYDLVTNIGGNVVLNFEKSGYGPAQKTVSTGEQTYYSVETPMMVKQDEKVTTVTLGGSEHQSVVANPVSDSDGTRTASLIMPPGLQAQVQMSDGSLKSVPNLNVRMTEVTVGENGQKKMPAPLPPRSAYTYAIELTSDEATALGGKGVQFDKEVPFYVDNFLNLPVGTAVPLGYYDPQTKSWKAEKDGIIASIDEIVDGKAVLSFAPGKRATRAQLAHFNITDGELYKLARIYRAGTTVSRITTKHFSYLDLNFMSKGEPLQVGAANPEPTVKPCGPCNMLGSNIEVNRGILKESIKIPGVPFNLLYVSSLSRGYKSNSITVPLSGPTFPAELLGIHVTLTIAGKTVEQDFEPGPNLVFSYFWDGKDSFGRRLLSGTNASLRIAYRYRDTYGFKRYDPDMDSTFDISIPNTTLTTGRGELAFNKAVSVFVQSPEGIMKSHALKNFGQWTIPIHHRLDPDKKIVYRGDGGEISSVTTKNFLTTIAGGASGFVDDVPLVQAKFRNLSSYTLAPDGTVLFLDRGNYRIRRLGKDGIVHTIAGTGTPSFNGDNILATSAQIQPQGGLYQTRNGTVIFADTGNNRIRRITPAGIIQTIAGTGVAGYSGDGDMAINAQLNHPKSLHGSLDGSIYFADADNNVIRRIKPNGTIETFAGNGTAGFSGDGGLAKEAQLNNPRASAVDASGNVVISDIGNSRIRKIAPNGIITTIAGTGTAGFSGDGGPATQAQLNKPTYVNLLPDGAMYITDNGNRVIRFVDTDGKISTVIGSGGSTYNGERLSFEKVNLPDPTVASLRPDGAIYIVAGGNRILKTSNSLIGVEGSNYVVTSPNGDEIYYFSPQGIHLRTLSALTGAVLYTFHYDSEGFLSSIEDGYGKATTFERSGTSISGIVSPYGQRTALTYSSSGFLESLTTPKGASYSIGYTNEGLLESFKKPMLNTTTFEYDELGKLKKETSAAGGVQQIVSGLGKKVHTTAMGYRTEVADSSDGLGLMTNTLLRTGVRVYSYGGEGATSNGANFSDGRTETVSSESDSRFSSSVSYAYNAMKRSQSTVGTYIEFISTKISYPFLNGVFNFVREITVTGPNSETSKTVFNTSNLSEVVTTGLGRKSASILDAHEALVSSQVGGFAPVQYTYDGDGRLTQIQQGDRATQMVYNSQGQVSQITDALGQVTLMSYDTDGNMITQTTNDGRVHNFNYDLNSNLVGVTPAARDLHQLFYTVLDLFTMYKPPTVGGSSLPTGIEYNLDRQPTKLVRADGRNVEYGYNSAGLVNQLTSVDRNVAMTYQFGQLTKITSPESSLTFSWRGDYLKSKTYTSPFALQISNNFVSGKTRVESIAMNGQNLAMGYDADGNVTQVGALAIARDTLSPVVTGTALQNLTLEMSYDNFGAVLARVYNYGGSPIYSESYTRDKLGRITAKTVADASGEKSYSYSYNSAGRLSEVKLGQATISQYLYDEQGNRIQSTISGIGALGTYDAQDRLVTYGSYQYFFNADGELTSKLNTANSQTTSYAYTTLGQLSSVSLPNGHTISYGIDGENKRMSRSVDGVLQSYYAYDSAGRLVAELDSTGSLKSRFVYATQGHSPDYMITASGVYGFIKDQLGSVKRVVNATSGAVAQSIEYDEFGRVLSDTSPMFQPFGFAGGIYDSETKLVRFGARDYDAETGRWMSKDPILFDGGDLNLYAHVGVDPVNKIDPSGKANLIDRLDGAGGAGASPGIISIGEVIGAIGAMMCPGNTSDPKSPPSKDPKICGKAFDAALLGCARAPEQSRAQCIQNANADYLRCLQGG